MAAINPLRTRVEKPRPTEELVQLPLNISVLCTVHACAGNHHHIPPWCKRPAIDELSDASLRAVSLHRAPYLLANHQTQSTAIEAVGNRSHHHHTAVECASPPKHRRELLVSRQRREPAHPGLDGGEFHAPPGAA